MAVEGEWAISAPHVQPAQKGFDGLLVQLSASTEAMWSVVISEDKATSHSRNTVMSEVGPDFERCERGLRDAELTNEVTTLLKAHQPNDIDSLIGQINWKERRRYRVSITITGEHDGNEGRSRLFEGYDGVVARGFGWPTRDSLLPDGNVDVTGCQADFIELPAGHFQFSHSCGGTFAIEASWFENLYDGPIF